MSEIIWENYFVSSLRATGADGHIPAAELRERITAHRGGEAYHCAYDLEQRPDFSDYEGAMRPALAHVWFDFDSHDGGVAALEDARKFTQWVNINDAFVCYSGSKGFHVGVPFGYFGLDADRNLGKKLHALATKLKETYPTIDTTVYNANRKFRALGSRHPKTKLYKIRCDLSKTLEEIKVTATGRGDLTVPIPEKREPIDCFTKLLKTPLAQVEKTDSIGLDLWRRYRQPKGDEAFKQCGFLSWARDNPNSVDEPQWYACASIVGRFEDGRHQFHTMSKGHRSYNVTATDEKLEQAMQVSGPRTCAAIEKLWGGCNSCVHYQKIVSPVVIMEKDMIATEATGFYDLIKNNVGEIKRVPNYRGLTEGIR